MNRYFRKGFVFGIMLLFLRAGVVSGINTKIENLDKSNLYRKTLIVPIEYPTIQDAVDNASNGDIIRVWEGNYTESVNVNKQVQIIGNGSAVTHIIAKIEQLYCFEIRMNENITISGFEISNCKNVNGGAVDILFARGITVSYNLFLNNYIDIRVESSKEANIIYNEMREGQGDNVGIWVWLCESVYINNNNILYKGNAAQTKYSTGGIRLDFSEHNFINYNNVTHSYNGLCLFGTLFNTINHNNFTDNAQCGIHSQYSFYDDIQYNNVFRNLLKQICVTNSIGYYPHNWWGSTLGAWGNVLNIRSIVFFFPSRFSGPWP